MIWVHGDDKIVDWKPGRVLKLKLKARVLKLKLKARVLKPKLKY
jgi:hypothetical protein